MNTYTINLHPLQLSKMWSKQKALDDMRKKQFLKTEDVCDKNFTNVLKYNIWTVSLGVVTINRMIDSSPFNYKKPVHFTSWPHHHLWRGLLFWSINGPSSIIPQFLCSTSHRNCGGKIWEWDIFLTHWKTWRLSVIRSYGLFKIACKPQIYSDIPIKCQIYFSRVVQYILLVDKDWLNDTVMLYALKNMFFRKKKIIL